MVHRKTKTVDGCLLIEIIWITVRTYPILHARTFWIILSAGTMHHKVLHERIAKRVDIIIWYFSRSGCGRLALFLDNQEVELIQRAGHMLLLK
jgi:hypothetical protein